MGTQTAEPDRDGKKACLLSAWAPYLALFAAGLIVFIWKIRIVAPIRLVGLVDPAAYAEMASSLLSGRWLEVDYISMHFRKWSPLVSHPEETWPPFYSFLIVPFFAVMGKTALAAKLPSLLISCLGLPPVTGALAKRVTGSRIAAAVSGVTVLLSGPVFHWSLYATADVTFGFLVTAAVLLAIKGFEDSRWFFPMGAVLAFAYYAKGSALVIIPAFVLYYVLRRLLDRPRAVWFRGDVHFAAGIGLVVVLLLPWFIRNTVHFNDPLYCTHKHVAGYVGWEPWEESTYRLYWDEEPPSIMRKLEQPGRLARESLRYLLRQIRLLFLKMDDRVFMFPDTPLEPFALGEISTYWIGVPALLGIFVYLAGGSVLILGRLRRRGSGRSKVSELLGPFLKPEYGLFFLVGLSLLSFLIVFWVPTSRYTTPIIPLMFVWGWATLYAILDIATGKMGAPRYAAGVLVLLLFIPWGLHEHRDLIEARESRGFPWKDTGRAWIEVGEWLRDNAPGSVTLTKNPWGLHFYSGEKAVQIPCGPLEDVWRAARYYGATHLIPDPLRPALRPWLSGTIPGLRQVYRAGHLRLYAIDWEKTGVDGKGH